MQVYTVSSEKSPLEIWVACDLGDSEAFRFAVDAVRLLGASHERIRGRFIAVFIPSGQARELAA